MSQCNAMRTAETAKKLPGQQTAYRCRNRAHRRITVHQASDHGRIADGWFEVDLCDKCFYRSEAHAIVNTKGRMPWRWIREVG